MTEPSPLRGPLPRDVAAAARTVSLAIWREPYRPGRGPMHYAAGLFWPASLRERARKLRRLADAAEVCAVWIETTELAGARQEP